SGGPSSGYTSTGIWSCTAGVFTSPNKVTLALNQSATCTITNNDQAPHLTLAKHVNNTYGGTADASAWTLTAAGDGGFSGTGLPASGPDASKAADVTAAVQYTLSESGGPSSGYTSTGIWSCTAGVFESPNKVTLALNQSTTCTITNNDQVAHLIIKKVVDNNTNGDGGLTAVSFSGTFVGVTATDGNTWTGPLTNKTLT